MPRVARPAWAESHRITEREARDGQSGAATYDLPIVGRIALRWHREDRPLLGEHFTLHWVVSDSKRAVEYHLSWITYEREGEEERYDADAFEQLMRLVRDVIKPKETG